MQPLKVFESSFNTPLKFWGFDHVNHICGSKEGFFFFFGVRTNLNRDPFFFLEDFGIERGKDFFFEVLPEHFGWTIGGLLSFCFILMFNERKFSLMVVFFLSFFFLLKFWHFSDYKRFFSFSFMYFLSCFKLLYTLNKLLHRILLKREAFLALKIFLKLFRIIIKFDDLSTQIILFFFDIVH